MGVLPLQFRDGETAESLGLTGEETFDMIGVDGDERRRRLPRTVTVRADGQRVQAVVRIDTPGEAGVLPPRRDHAVRAAVAAVSR